MKRPIESEIETIIDDIDHQLKEVDRKLDRIRLLLNSVEEAGAVQLKQDAGAVELKEESGEVDWSQIERLVREFKEGRREEVADSAGNYGKCPVCGSPLSVLSRAPLMVECSNRTCPNRFPPR